MSTTRPLSPWEEGLAQPRLKRIDLETCTVTELPLGRALAVGGAPPADVVIPGASPQFRLSRRGGRWRLEGAAGGDGTWLNGRRVASAELEHGDAIWLRQTILVFVDRPEASNAALEAAVTERPDDAARVRVWADWLIEHGDPLGGHLLSEAPADFVLEGLAPLTREGRLELDWQHGLLRAARLRTINDATWSNVELLARLLSLRVARWLRELTVDLSTWVMPSAAGLQTDATATLRRLINGPALPLLEKLSLGYLVQALPRSSFADELLARLATRYPKLDARRDAVLPVARHAWLEVEAVPPDVDFHHPGRDLRRVPLDSGVWVSVADHGRLRAVPPGVQRPGVPESFLVRQEAPLWCLVPLEPGLTLNGHPAVATRLLPGDVITQPRGAQYRFCVGV